MCIILLGSFACWVRNILEKLLESRKISFESQFHGVSAHPGGEAMLDQLSSEQWEKVVEAVHIMAD